MTATATALQSLWSHTFADRAGYIGLFSGCRSDGKLVDTRSKFLAWPAAATNAEGWLEDEAAQGREVYAGAHLLTDKRRVKENAAPILTLWADIDTATIPDDLPAPTALIESSPGRLQGYWRLTRAIEPARAEQLNKRLAAAIGADPSGADLTQILRPPGMPNYKYAGAPPVRLVELHDGEAYDPDQLDMLLPEAPAQPPHAPLVPCAADDPMNDEDVIARLWAYQGDKGARIRRLWSGDSRDYRDAAGEPDESRGDLALCNYIVDAIEATGEMATAAQADRIYRLSERTRDKWDEKHYADGRTYGQQTIRKALNRTRLIISNGADKNAHDAPADLAAEVERLRAENARLTALVEQLQAALEVQASILRTEREQRQTREDALTRTQERASLEARVRRNGAMKAVRETLIAVAREVESAPDPAAVDIILGTVAKKVGKTPQTISDHLGKLEDWGFLERGYRQVTRQREYNGATFDQIETQLSVMLAGTPRDILERAVDFEPPVENRWGGVRYQCPKHPHAGVIVTTTVECAECGDILFRGVEHAKHYDSADPNVETPPCHLDMGVEPSASVDTVSLGGHLDMGVPRPTHQDDMGVRPQNHCQVCGAPCGGGVLCSACARDATPVRGRRSA